MQYVPLLVLLYAVVSVALLWAHQSTRLYPLYILKTVWVGFSILAFAWVVAMSGGQSKEYIQHPTGPMEIFVGSIVEVPGDDGKPMKKLDGGYAGTLHKYTHTKPYWIVGFLFTAWTLWGLMRDAGRARMITDEAPITSSTAGLFDDAAPGTNPDDDPAPQAQRPRISLSGFFTGAACALLLTGLIYLGSGGPDAAIYLTCTLGWCAFAFASPARFLQQGHRVLLLLLFLALLPLIPPVFAFEWSRYTYFGENYAAAWNEGHIGVYFINSLIVTITTVAMTTLFGSMAAYAIARRDFAGKNVLYGAIIGSIAIPGILIQVPLFLLIKDWGFTAGEFHYSFMDSRLGLSIIYTALSMPFTIFVLAGFFRTLPGSLGEAACIDGCGRWRTFTQIYLPLAMPGIATTGIFNFLGSWNEFNLGMIFMSNPNFKTLPIGLYELQAATQYSAAWAPMFAGIVLLCLPTFLIFLFLQERIVAGLTAGGMKG